jgi:hypothetical protein
MGFKMMPGSRSHGLKTGQGMAERGLISGGPKAYPVSSKPSKPKRYEVDKDLGDGVSDRQTAGPKAYPLANNDPNSKPIMPWEVDVDLGDGTLDRQTAITDLVQNPNHVVSKEEAKDNEEYNGYEGVAPVSDYKPEAEIGRFSKALQKANTSPEGGQTFAFTRADNYMKDRGRNLSLMGGASTVEGNDYSNRFSSNRDNDYYKGLEDTPVSAMMGRTGIMDSQRADQMNQVTGNIGKNYLNKLDPTNPAYNANSSSMFEIKRNRDTNLHKANIKSAEEVASDLKKRGTLDPTYLDKLDAYKKNKETRS